MKLTSLAIAATALSLTGAGVLLHPGVPHAESPMATKLSPSPIPAGKAFTVDAAHTSIGFEIGHLNIASVQGRFNKFAGEINFDETDLTKSTVNFTIQANSVDTNVAPRDTHLRSADFFDVEKYPELSFKSRSVTKREGGYTVAGDLTMRGVTKPVSINFRSYGPIKDPWGNNRIGVIAEPLVLKRDEFGITYGPGTIGNDVTVRLSLEATEKK